jgi:hypothetical protein
MATATVKHPETGEESTFEYPDDNTDPTIRYEHSDGTKGEYENPNGVAAGDPDTDDVIWDGRINEWVARVSEEGSSVDAAG